MDDATFDRLTRSIGRATSRRRIVAGLAGIMIGGTAMRTRAAQSAATALATPAATPANGAVNAYRNDRFGYYLTALAPWRVIQDTSTAEGDELVLSNGVSTVTFFALATTADPTRAVEQVTSTYFSAKHANDITAAPNTATLPDTNERATATHTYRPAAAATASTQHTASFECLTLTPGASTLTIIHDVASNDADAQQASFAELLTHLVIPLHGVKTYTGLSHQHTLGRVTYPVVPPVGGPHNPIWQDCGFYDTPIANEHAVHSMEHGAIWITFLPNLPGDQVAIIRQLATTIKYILASPYPGLPSPVVASAWSAQLHLADADEIRLRSFIATYQYGPDTEQGGPCSGGTSSPAF